MTEINDILSKNEKLLLTVKPARRWYIRITLIFLLPLLFSLANVWAFAIVGGIYLSIIMHMRKLCLYVTDRRIIRRQGILILNTREVTLDKVEAIQVGSMTGNISFRCAGLFNRMTFSYADNPLKLRTQIQDIIEEYGKKK